MRSGKNEGIAVDTHVRRLAQRIGFSDTDNVEIIERDLMALFPQDDVGRSHGCPDCPRAGNLRCKEAAV